MPNKKEAQKNPNLRIKERVESGCLLEKEGFRKLYKQVLKESPDAEWANALLEREFRTSCGLRPTSIRLFKRWCATTRI